MNDAESLERGLVRAGLDALRQLRGDAVVRVIVNEAVAQGRTDHGGEPSRFPIVDYVRYRDAVLGYEGESFGEVAFETGRTLVRNLRHRKVDEIRALIAQLGSAPTRLAVIGQAAVLAAKDNPGVVRAAMKGDGLLVITIEKCPECRGLKRETPFCFLNQGIITEFAARYLDVRVRTQETACIAMGAPRCEVEVTQPA
jgi:predicted hydrocarbon binding protein